MKKQTKKLTDEFISKALPILKEHREEKLKAAKIIKEMLSAKYNISENELIKIINCRKRIVMQKIRDLNAPNAL